VPSSVEFRRKINFVFIQKVNTSSQKRPIEPEADESQSLADAKRSKKKKK
jgi:hypothetical protein